MAGRNGFMARARAYFTMIGVLLAGFSLSSCGFFEGGVVEPTRPNPEDENSPGARQRERSGTVTGEAGITLFEANASRKTDEAAGGGGVGVNAFLWRASLETLDFIPLASADPFGGLIITDWYQPAGSAGERFKLNVLIRDRSLRADGVKVSVFRQVRDGLGWVDAPSAPETALSLEDKILTRARELRIASLDG